jgi:hypothetical protein
MIRGEDFEHKLGCCYECDADAVTAHWHYCDSHGSQHHPHPYYCDRCELHRLCADCRAIHDTDEREEA